MFEYFSWFHEELRTYYTADVNKRYLSIHLKNIKRNCLHIHSLYLIYSRGCTDFLCSPHCLDFIDMLVSDCVTSVQFFSLIFCSVFYILFTDVGKTYTQDFLDFVLFCFVFEQTSSKQKIYSLTFLQDKTIST